MITLVVLALDKHSNHFLNRPSLHKILNNEVYFGTLVWAGRPGHTAIHSGEPPVRVENAFPAIIDSETFKRVQDKMSSNTPQVVHPRTVPSFDLFSGLLFCFCGQAMIGRSAKSHRYYYYSCNRSNKQGKDSCNSRAFPKEKLEREVIDRIKDKVLTQECLEELVKLVNEELGSANLILNDKQDAVDAELNDVSMRLLKLYEALETGKLSLDDLAPRIKELKARQDELSKARVQVEAEMLLCGGGHVDAETVKSYAQGLGYFLEESGFTELSIHGSLASVLTLGILFILLL